MPDELTREFNKRGPWVTKFIIHGQEYGGAYDAAGDPRLKWFQQHFPEAQSVLELGCLEGGHSFALASIPHIRRVVAIEGRKINWQRAKFVQSVLKQPKVEFVYANLERCELAHLGKFDVVFCSGLLYHLPQPWKLLEQVRQVAQGVYIWTHYAQIQDAKAIRGHYQGRVYREWFFWFEALSGMSATSFWPTREGLLAMLADYGYEEIKVVEDNPQHEHGPAITIAARQK